MICPLKFMVYANPSPEDKVYQCQKEQCAWWHPNAGTPPEVGAGICQVARIADKLAGIYDDMPIDPSTLLK